MNDIIAEFTLVTPYTPAQELPEGEAPTVYTKVLCQSINYRTFRDIQKGNEAAFDLACNYAVVACLLSTEDETQTLAIPRQLLESSAFHPSDFTNFVAATGILLGGFDDFTPVGDGIAIPIYYKLRKPFKWVSDTNIIGLEFKALDFGAMRAFLVAEGFHEEISSFMQGYAKVATDTGEEIPYTDAILNKMDCRDVFTVRETILSGKFVMSRESFKKR